MTLLKWVSPLTMPNVERSLHVMPKNGKQLLPDWEDGLVIDDLNLADCVSTRSYIVIIVQILKTITKHCILGTWRASGGSSASYGIKD